MTLGMGMTPSLPQSEKTPCFGFYFRSLKAPFYLLLAVMGLGCCAGFLWLLRVIPTRCDGGQGRENGCRGIRGNTQQVRAASCPDTRGREEGQPPRWGGSSLLGCHCLYIPASKPVFIPIGMAVGFVISQAEGQRKPNNENKVFRRLAGPAQALRNTRWER